MHIKESIIIFIYLFVGIVSVFAQKRHTEICVDFRLNRMEIDSTYMSNAERLNDIIEFITQLSQDTTLNVTQVTFSGVASPEGNYQVNKRLANGRMVALEKYIRSRIHIPENIVIRHNEIYIHWDYLIEEVKSSDLLLKKEILCILNGNAQLVPYHNGSCIDSRILALQKLDNGKVWHTLYKRYFAKMRNACAIFITKEEPQLITEPNTNIRMVEVPVHPEVLSKIPSSVCNPGICGNHLYLKTNTIGLLMGIANLTIEVDLKKHWSIMLPVQYSAWNYFKSTMKFRTFGIQPEVRYWCSEINDGFFTGIHLGLASYNFAFRNDYRYQDHNGKKPAIGGGVSMGYRMPISKDKRWKMEFSIGGGVYSLHYDKFHNTPQTKDGLMIEDVKKTYFGIDQAAISFAYTIDWKKGGKR